MLHHSLHVAGLAEHGELPLGAGALAENRMHVIDCSPAAQVVHHIVDEFEQLDCQLAHWDFFAFAEVDQLAIDAPADGAPFVLFDQRPVIDTETLILSIELVELDDDRLRQRGQTDRILDARGDVADAELESTKIRMRAHIPPDLLGIVHAAQFYEQVDVVLILAPGTISVGDAGAWKAAEDRGAIRFQTRVAAQYKRRTG